MKSLHRALIITLLALPAAAFAADTSPTPSMPRDPVLEKVSAATMQQDWGGAQSLLKEALSRDPGNADYHNLYAYTIRKGPNPDMDLVFKHYNEALRIDPRHRGAHEYIGEAYLMVGNVAKAKEHLSALDKICFFGCSEYNDLKKAIAEAETKTVKQ